MARPEYFDFTASAEKADISGAIRDRLFSRILEEHLGDRMLAELRMLRVCRSIEAGEATLDDAMADYEVRPLAPR